MTVDKYKKAFHPTAFVIFLMHCTYNVIRFRLADSCASNPCQNDATCERKEADFAHDYVCECVNNATMKYYGIHCENGEGIFT